MNLKTLRELKGISRKDLALATGISFRSIQDYEQGHKELSSAKADTILKMSKALDCTMEDLISDVDLSSLKPSELEEMVSGENVRSHVAKATVEACTDADMTLAEEKGKDRETVQEVDCLSSYVLMHKDDKVAALVFEPVSGAIVTVTEVYSHTLLPIGTDGPDVLLKAWWHRRAVPVTQGAMSKILDKAGFMTPQAYLLKSMGLSLTDDYWVKPQDSKETWAQVNLFDNEFDDVIGASHFAGLENEMDIDNSDVRFPSASVGGNVPKSWVCMEGRRYLVKGTEKGNTQQIFNEVVGSYIHRKQGKFEFVDYQFYTIDYGHGKQLGVSAEAFTNANLEFIPASELIRAHRIKHSGASDYDLFVDAASKGGLDRDEVVRFLDYQILTDFVITNTDRNYENFGVLRDAGTLEFVKLAPIFDSGNSMFYDLNMNHGTLELNNITVNSFADNEAGLIRLVKDPSIVDLDKLMTDEELGQVLASSNRTPEEIRVLVKIYDRKKDMLFKLKRGDMSWLKKA
ncbi:XRE family transcriptional regulator [Oribacterium sp. WCC10]|uniref:XRE family transcriptional regulator n=1 Tax=Oribacterium sp. WCC10 TaxID=1855343 RepID=UPI0008E9BC35|nr:XRE family transcriptional regulator [Oribacterium sp. WCC10]SFG26962.1 Helix-turn-helix [Oribacterium sp. WCC10]